MWSSWRPWSTAQVPLVRGTKQLCITRSRLWVGSRGSGKKNALLAWWSQRRQGCQQTSEDLPDLLRNPLPACIWDSVAGGSHRWDTLKTTHSVLCIAKDIHVIIWNEKCSNELENVLLVFPHIPEPFFPWFKSLHCLIADFHLWMNQCKIKLSTKLIYPSSFRY